VEKLIHEVFFTVSQNFHFLTQWLSKKTSFCLSQQQISTSTWMQQQYMHH